MTTRDARGSTATAPITYPEPPTWLRSVPSRLLRPGPGTGGDTTAARTERLLDYLRDFGLPRPSLLDLEAERHRRGFYETRRKSGGRRQRSLRTEIPA